MSKLPVGERKPSTTKVTEARTPNGNRYFLVPAKASYHSGDRTPRERGGVTSYAPAKRTDDDAWIVESGFMRSRLGVLRYSGGKDAAWHYTVQKFTTTLIFTSDEVNNLSCGHGRDWTHVIEHL